MLLICAGFVGLGIWVGHSAGWIGYLAAGFIGLGIPVALLQLLPASSYLEIDDTGISFSSLFRKKSIPWSVIDEFYVVTFKQSGLTAHKMVGFNYIQSYEGERLGRRVAKLISNCEGALPDTYGKTAEELAELLNSYLQRANRGEDHPEPGSE